MIPSMNGEIQPLVTDGPVDLKKWPVLVQDFRQIVDPFRGIYGINLKEKPKDINM